MATSDVVVLATLITFDAPDRLASNVKEYATRGIYTERETPVLIVPFETTEALEYIFEIFDQLDGEVVNCFLPTPLLDKILARLPKHFNYEDTSIDKVDLDPLKKYINGDFKAHKAVNIISHKSPQDTQNKDKTLDVETILHATGFRREKRTKSDIQNALQHYRALDTFFEGSVLRTMYARINPMQIKHFIRVYLNERDTNDLFWILAGQRAKKYFESFQQEFSQNIEMWEVVFWTHFELPTGYDWPNWKAWITLRTGPNTLLGLAASPIFLLLIIEFYKPKKRVPKNLAPVISSYIQELFLAEGFVTLAKRKYLLQLTTHAADYIRRLGDLAFFATHRASQTSDPSSLSELLELELKLHLTDNLVELSLSNGILNKHQEKLYFSHPLIQQYFAAIHIWIEKEQGNLHIEDLYPKENWWAKSIWDDVLIMLSGLFDDSTIVTNWCYSSVPEIAAECILKSNTSVSQKILENYQSDWLVRLNDVQVEPHPYARASIGRALGRLKLDKREGILGEKVPQIDWVKVEEGEFIFQSGESAYESTYHVSRYLVTYSQYECFVKGEGYQNNKYWTDEGLEWKNKFKAQHPLKGWNEAQWHISNHPIVFVTWFEATAFCQWLSNILEMVISLPSEHQWEKCARGKFGNIYPWGSEYMEGYANIDEPSSNNGFYYLGRTSAVGIYPQGNSPHKIADLSGNVWEWCMNKYPNIDDINLHGSERRIIRGGSWRDVSLASQTTSRNYATPDAISNDRGFRIYKVG